MNAARSPQRLLSSRQFRKVYEQGRKFQTTYFTAFFLKQDGGEQRAGITVTRKIGNAVVRNRCKRRLREIVRKHQLDELNGVGFDLVLNVKSGLAQAEFKVLEADFLQTLSRFRSFCRQQEAKVEQ